VDLATPAARPTSRRSPLRGRPRRRAGAVLLIVGASVLSGCGSSDSESSSDGVTTVDYQLSWTKDYEWGGSFLADDRGYYSDAGVEVDMIAGGGSSSPVQAVASGQALVASASLDEAAQLTADGGADLAIIGATFQKNGLNILSRADDPITTPQDLVGKRIGVFASNDPQWSLFLELNGIDKSSITEVPVQYDVTPLVTGDVDGYQGYAGGELTTLQAQGVDPQVMLFADNGYNPVSAGYVVRRESLEDPEERAALKAFLEGEIRGWEDIVYDGDAAEGARLAVEEYGKDLGLDQATQEASLEALIGYVATPYTEENGLLRISPESLESSQRVLDSSGIDVQIDDLVTNELLDEIYDGKNRLG
jgi:ABC-type nitrate/sulfonate/bicarbonate transport system substrate-binding protein